MGKLTVTWELELETLLERSKGDTNHKTLGTSPQTGYSCERKIRELHNLRR